MNSRRLLLPIDFFMVLFAVSATIGTVIAYDRALSIPYGLTIMTSVVLYFLITYLVRTWEAARWISIGLMVAGTGVALFFISQYSHQNYGEAWGIIRQLGQLTTFLPDLNIYLHTNSAATFIESMIPLGVALAVTAHEKRARAIWILCVAVLLYAVFLSFSRGTWIALAATLFITAVLYSRRTAQAAAAVAVLSIGAVLFLAITQPTLVERGLMWTASRYELYRNSLYVVMDYAYTGAGLGNTFALVYSRYGLLIQVPYLYYTHNLPLAVWFGQGLLGLAALVGLVVTFYLFVRRVLVASRPRRLFHGAWLGVTTALIHGLFDARQYSEIGWLMPVLFIFIGLSVVMGRLSLEQFARGARATQARLIPPWMPIGAAVLLMVLGVVFNRHIRAAWQTNLGALSETRADLAENLNEVQRRDLYNDALMHYHNALYHVPTWPSANRRMGNLNVNLENFAEAVPLLESAYAAEMVNPASIKGLGLAYTWVGRTDDAVTMFQRLSNPRAMQEELVIWGTWRSGRDESELAAYAVEAAVSMSPDTPDPLLWYFIAENYRAASDMEKARHWYERVLEVAPEHEGARSGLAAIQAVSS